jgi:hypothetical protein
VAALAAVLVPSGGAAGNAPELAELFSISGSLKCGGTDLTECAKIPGTPGTQQQLGGAEFHLWLYRSLDKTRTWGNGVVRFEVHTLEPGFLDDPPTGPHPTAITQINTYTSWFIAPSNVFPCPPSEGPPACTFVPARGAWFRNIFWVNGTSVVSGGFNFGSDQGCLPTCTLVNQPTQHPAVPGHYNWENTLEFIAGPAPPGINTEVNVTQSFVNTVAP